MMGLDDHDGFRGLGEVPKRWTLLKEGEEPLLDSQQPPEARRVVCVPILDVMTWILETLDEGLYADQEYNYNLLVT